MTCSGPGEKHLLALLACFSHQLSAAARDQAASTSFRLVAVLDVRFKYASARRPARASYPLPSHAPRYETWREKQASDTVWMDRQVHQET